MISCIFYVQLTSRDELISCCCLVNWLSCLRWMNMFIFLFAHRDWSYVLTQLTSFLSNTLSPLEGLNTPLAAILAQNLPEMYFISLLRNMDKLFGFVFFPDDHLNCDTSLKQQCTVKIKRILNYSVSRDKTTIEINRKVFCSFCSP